MTDLERTVADRVRRDHADVVAAIDRCADAVAASWTGGRATDRRDVADPLRAALRRTGVLERLPDVLADVADAAGHDLPARPVAAPPYVAIASRGPVLRATLPPGRLVVRLDAFAVHRDPAPAYERLDGVDVVVSLE